MSEREFWSSSYLDESLEFQEDESKMLPSLGSHGLYAQDQEGGLEVVMGVVSAAEIMETVIDLGIKLIHENELNRKSSSYLTSEFRRKISKEIGYFLMTFYSSIRI